MTTSTPTTSTHATTTASSNAMTAVQLDDLPPTERAQVQRMLEATDRNALAAAAGLTLAQLDALPALSSKRGTFRTPYPLLAAVSGYGHGGQRATSVGQVLRRLGFTVNARTGLLDKGGYHRVQAAADFFGIDLPRKAKDGPAAGRSLRHDVDAFTAAWNSARTLTELATALHQKPSGDTNTRNRARGAELGLPDKFPAARTPPRRPAR